MAEILISLTIIGVIAAITLPSLRANINESAWATQRKALYSRLSQAISMLPSLNGYGLAQNTDETPDYATINEKAAMAFVTDGLNKVLKINNICDRTNLSKCGLPDKFTTMRNSKMNFPKDLTELNPMFTSTYIGTSGTSYTNPQKDINTNIAAFETVNGESVGVFYNPLCRTDNVPDYISASGTNMYYVMPLICANFLYDLNGKKGPNKVGKDIGFITALYPVEPNIVAPMPLTQNAKNGNDTSMAQTDAAAACKKQDENLRVPNRDELAAMFCNKVVMGVSDDSEYSLWSSTLSTSDASKAWYQAGGTGMRYEMDRSWLRSVRCIKR